MPPFEEASFLPICLNVFAASFAGGTNQNLASQTIRLVAPSKTNDLDRELLQDLVLTSTSRYPATKTKQSPKPDRCRTNSIEPCGTCATSAGG